MLLPWSKPPREITCPVCGAKVQVHRDKNRQFQPKPYCNNCGWNVARARKRLLALILQNVLIAVLAAVYGWVMTGTWWIMPFFAGWMLIVMGVPIITHLRRLPQSRPTPPLQPLEGIADLGNATLDATTPRLNIILEGLIVVALTIAILFVSRELDPTQRRWPGVRHELLFVIFTTIFAAYQIAVHGIQFFRLVRSIWLEHHLAKRALMGKGRIIESDSGTVKYEFLDYTNHSLCGAGRDYTLGLYEDMPLSVLYDPDDPSLNMPVVGLQFHRQHEAP